MNIQEILSELRIHRNRIDQAILALEGPVQKRGPGRPAKSTSSAPVRKHFQMSAVARKRIAEAKRKWWAEQKKAKKRR